MARVVLPAGRCIGQALKLPADTEVRSPLSVRRSVVGDVPATEPDPSATPAACVPWPS